MAAAIFDVPSHLPPDLVRHAKVFRPEDVCWHAERTNLFEFEGFPPGTLRLLFREALRDGTGWTIRFSYLRAMRATYGGIEVIPYVAIDFEAFAASFDDDADSPVIVNAEPNP